MYTYLNIYRYTCIRADQKNIYEYMYKCTHMNTIRMYTTEEKVRRPREKMRERERMHT